MANENQVLILRDGDGNMYLISGNALEAGKLPEDKKKILEEALGGDVGGFFFRLGSDFQQAFTTTNQSNSASALNVAGGVSVLSPQSIQQLQGNIANVNTRQRA